MKTYERNVLCCIVIILLLTGSAQYIHFSQFNEAPLMRNTLFARLFPAHFHSQKIYHPPLHSAIVHSQTTIGNGEFKNEFVDGKWEYFLILNNIGWQN